MSYSPATDFGRATQGAMTLLSQGRESVVSPAALPSTGSMACIKAEAGFLGSAKAGSPIIVMKSGEVVGMIKRAGEWTLLGLGGG